MVWLATHTVYRVRIFGREHLPEQGPALLMANHVSWLDGVFLLVTSSRPVRVFVDAELVQGRLSRWLARTMGAIPIKSTPKATRAALDEARRALAAGELVCIFPEGDITRTGHLQPFKQGVLEILRGRPVPVIPVYLDELWGSIFSYRGGGGFWKWPRRLPYPVSIWFGPPILRLENVQQARQHVQDLGAEAVRNRSTRSMLLPRKFVRQCRKRLFRSKVADSAGGDLTGGGLLTRALVLRRLLRREVLADDEQYVGLLLPPSVPAVVVNAALTLDRRVAANLNYTVSSETMNSCIRRAGIKHVLTSRKVMEKLELNIDAELIYLEDFKDKATRADKLAAALQTYCLPAAALERSLGLHKVRSDDVLTVIFTSGSTGEPKGVLLSQGNVLSNVEAIDQVVQIEPRDVFLGVLPFFHSFGYTTTLWTVLGLDVKGAYHFSPLDARGVGKLAGRHRATVVLCTPTFLRTYMRRCAPEDFASLEVVVVGAEKMPLELAASFEEKFGVRPVEGYGATELSPLVSVNVPPSRSRGEAVDVKEGTIGRAVPGVSVKVVDPETQEDLPPDAQGMLLVKGPNVMLGYLNQPEKTAEVIRDGWYITGDLAKIDRDGFITITGRESRFSKIGGEMVPHIRVEEELHKIVGHQEDQLALAVTAVPDARKGERLVVLYTELPMEIDEICARLAESGLPNLWIPSPDSFWQVDEIPVLGTGKLDLRGLQRAARERLGVA
jgi:acyl-[acyl-carrier-protein]-phospholipid O-acyltransferase/long-chain-fatty-acid--[acyl-carrier-protein] ligase